MTRMLKLCFLIWIVLFIVISQGYAQDISEEKPLKTTPFRGGLHLGFSPYNGVLGLELNRGHWSFTLGLPSSAGIIYYPDKQGYRWFMGASGMYYNFDEDNTEDGILYDEETDVYAGVSAGYKWRWRDHWDLSLSVSALYHRRLLENDFMERREDYIVFLPGVTVGYTF